MKKYSSQDNALAHLPPQSERIFKKYDTNKDGSVSTDEFRVCPCQVP
jgi:hypothetical protein